MDMELNGSGAISSTDIDGYTYGIERPEAIQSNHSVSEAIEQAALLNSSSLSMRLQFRQLSQLLNQKKRAAKNKSFIGSGTAWVDQDDSGTYDPTKDRASVQRKQTKRIKTLSPSDEGGNPKPRKSNQKKRFDGVVTFTFKSNKSLDYLRSITPEIPILTSNESNLDSSGDDTDESSEFLVRKKRFRRAKKATEIQREDGLTLEQLTLGHPQRRGCKACFRAGNDDCTLIDDGFDYPCEACVDGDIDCELIIPPKLKKDCERCKAKCLKCSYRRDKGKGKSSCKACEKEGIGCIAGPWREATRRMNDVLSRTTPERQIWAPPKSPSLTPPPVRPRVYIACNQCRNSSKYCSLKGKADPGPCSGCRKINQHCQFVIIPPSQLSALANHEGNDRKTRSNKRIKPQARKERAYKRARRDDGMQDSPNTTTEKIYSGLGRGATRKQQTLERKGNRHIFIITSYCHPITFNHIPDVDNEDPCSWCSNPLFGIHGLAAEHKPRKVEGFYHPNGRGFEEIMGGFSELGYTQSKMCYECTNERVGVMGCEFHHIRRLTEDETRGWSYYWKKFNEAAAKWMEKDFEGAKYFIEAQWCAICPNFASHKCARPQGQIGQHQGCGLLLCENCAEMAEKLIIGGVSDPKKVLDGLVREVGAQKWQFAYDVRADASFLTTSGELWDRLQKGFGIFNSQDIGANSQGEFLDAGFGNRGVEDDAHTSEAEELALMSMINKKVERKFQREERRRSEKERLLPGMDRGGNAEGTPFIRDPNKSDRFLGNQGTSEKGHERRLISHNELPKQHKAVDRLYSETSHGLAKSGVARLSENVELLEGRNGQIQESRRERGYVKNGGRVEPRREQVAMAFGGSIIDLTGDD